MELTPPASNEDTTNNPLHNPTDVLPQKARLWLYLIATLILLALTAWLAADGNWVEAVASFLTSLVTMLSASKTTQKYTITKE